MTSCSRLTCLTCPKYASIDSRPWNKLNVLTQAITLHIWYVCGFIHSRMSGISIVCSVSVSQDPAIYAYGRCKATSIIGSSAVPFNLKRVRIPSQIPCDPCEKSNQRQPKMFVGVSTTPVSFSPRLGKKSGTFPFFPIYLDNQIFLLTNRPLPIVGLERGLRFPLQPEQVHQVVLNLHQV